MTNEKYLVINGGSSSLKFALYSMPEEKELINNVFEFNDITVSEIMRHRKDIFAVDINISNEELLKELSKEEYRYSRIPVYDETIDEIKGILYIKDVLKNIEILEHKGNLDIDVTNISSDSRLIKQNGFFFAITGYKLKGTDFIESAIKNGATAILVQEGCDLKSLNIPEISLAFSVTKLSVK